MQSFASFLPCLLPAGASSDDTLLQFDFRRRYFHMYKRLLDSRHNEFIKRQAEDRYSQRRFLEDRFNTARDKAIKGLYERIKAETPDLYEAEKATFLESIKNQIIWAVTIPSPKHLY